MSQGLYYVKDTRQIRSTSGLHNLHQRGIRVFRIGGSILHLILHCQLLPHYTKLSRIGVSTFWILPGSTPGASSQDRGCSVLARRTCVCLCTFIFTYIYIHVHIHM